MASSTKATASSNVDKAPLNKSRNGWVWGFTPQAELWNGRLAMIGFASAVIVELLLSRSGLHVWNLL